MYNTHAEKSIDYRLFKTVEIELLEFHGKLDLLLNNPEVIVGSNGLRRD